ncbi:MAG: hypothetical protein KY455_12810 [Euryarchaeota archaeon]|nr:hypothetical protein [Euryarchaeota archaeon]
MGMESGATHAVFFIAALVLAGAVVATFNDSIQRFSGEIDDRGRQFSDELTTDIAIVNDVGSMPNNPVVLYVLNTGSRPLAPNETIVFIDGSVDIDLSFDVLETSEDTWRTGQVLKITMNGQNLASGDHRIKVSVIHGVSDTIRFNIP